MVKTVELALLPEEAANQDQIKKIIAANTGIGLNDISGFIIRKRSIDARSRKVKIRLIIDVFINEFFSEIKLPQRKLQNISNAVPVYIAGCGPAGLFAAIKLIESGFKPIIIERGNNVRERRRDLALINKKGIVNSESNYCFGEGGAGTYSDGKLYTRSGKRGSIENVLHTFVEFGADKNILIDAHPHIGTNKLPEIIVAIRDAIISCGGEIHFATKLTAIEKNSSEITGLRVRSLNSDTDQYIKCNCLVLATGHSARDIFEMLDNSNIYIEAKPFALGVRIEHEQKLIDRIQYHSENRGDYLPAASYSLVHQSAKGVYSFCMCPGGIIAPAATAPGEIVVNGWSPSKRNNRFANSGIVVTVEAKDFHQRNNGPLAALQYQSSIEQKAFIAGGNNLKAPAQRMEDFVNKKLSSSLPDCSYIPGLNSADINELLPDEISQPLREALFAFGKKMKGYYTNEAVIVGVESRTSSPVRIPRDNVTMMHTGVNGLFPCAEGAGYAGGIVSAAIDGEKSADAASKYLSDYAQR
jgi:uncharacterized FAD-dependent dehydrogenase